MCVCPSCIILRVAYIHNCTFVSSPIADCGTREEQLYHRAPSFKGSMSGPETKTEVFTVTEMGGVAAERGTSNLSNKRSVYEHYVQPCLAELFGTSLFMFVGCASVIGNVDASLIQPAVAHGLVLGVLIMVFGQIR